MDICITNHIPSLRKINYLGIGVTHKVGQAMCYWVLPPNGIPIARTTIQDVTKLGSDSEVFKRKFQTYDEPIYMMLNSSLDTEDRELKLYREDEDLDNVNWEQEPMKHEASPIDVDEIEPDSYDEVLLTEPVLTKDGQLTRAKIVGRKRDHDDNLIGNYNPNPVLNSRIHLAKFPDGHIQELRGNTIIEAIYNNIDDEGYQEQLFQDIIGHRSNNDALTKTQADAHNNLFQTILTV